jgi:hypothetical protein
MLARGGESPAPFTGAAARHRPWAGEEDDVIRRLFASNIDAADAAVAALPHRTRLAIVRRARTLGVACYRRHWTAADDQRLLLLWEDGLSLAHIAKRMGRPQEGVYLRARRIGLQLGIPRGYEYFTAACKRTGFCGKTMWRILSWAGVPTRVTLSRPTHRIYGRRRHFVDPLEVDDAISRWMATETPNDAAIARGIPPRTLWGWLKRAGLLKPAASGSRKAHRILSADIDRVVDEHRRAA